MKDIDAGPTPPLPDLEKNDAEQKQLAAKVKLPESVLQRQRELRARIVERQAILEQEPSE